MKSLTVNTRQFTYVPGEKTFLAEVSDLGWGLFPRTFDLQSAKTGNVVTMQLVHVDKDREGDTRYAEYKPASDVTFNLFIVND